MESSLNNQMNNDVLTVFRNGITYTCNPKCTGNIDKSVIRRNQVYFSSSNVSTDTMTMTVVSVETLEELK